MYNFDGMMIEAKRFAEVLLTELNEKKLLNEFSEIDHICYRTETIESYERCKEKFFLNGKLLSEAYVNGRPIATFKLHRPIRIGSSHSIHLIELPAPKSGQNINEGFDHIEVVSKPPLENILDRFPDLKFDIFNISASINRDISILLKQGLVKFHEQSLEDVILKEKEVIEKRKREKLVLIDFDETLVKSKDQFIEASLFAVSKYLGANIAKDEFVNKMMPTFPELFKQWGIVKNREVNKVVSFFQEECRFTEDMISIPNGMISMISCLYHEGIDIIVWTARDYKSAESFISKSPLSKYINRVIGFDGAESSKPKLKSEDLLSFKNKKIIMIGDSNSDRDGAKNIKAKFFQARWLRKSELGLDSEDICRSPFEFLNKAISHFRSPSL